MNNNDRKELKEALALFDEAKDIIEAVKERENEKFYNLSDGLQNSEMGKKLEENTSTLEDALNYIEQAAENIEEVIE